MCFIWKIGRYKRKCWAFQNEYRYIITTAPWTIDELENVKTVEEQIQIFDRLLDNDNKQICNEMYLALSDDAFEGMEILLAPKNIRSRIYNCTSITWKVIVPILMWN